MPSLKFVRYEYDGDPSSVPEDALQAATARAEKLAGQMEVRQECSVYLPARSSDDFPEGTWTWNKPASRGRWHARYTP